MASRAFVWLLLLVAGPASAEPWALVGARQQGMGGAGVASTMDSLATYWNPAALAFEDARLDVQFPISANASAEGDVFEIYAGLRQTARRLEDALAGSGSLTQSELSGLLDLLFRGLPGADLDDEGFALAAHTGLVGRYKRFGFGVHGIATGAADFFFDGLEPVVNPSLTDLLKGRQNVLKLAGAATNRRRIDGGAFGAKARCHPFFGCATSLPLASQVALHPNWDPGRANTLVEAFRDSGFDLSDRELRERIVRFASDVGSGADLTLAGSAGALVRGIATVEPGVAYGYLLEDVPWLGDVAIGANAKLIVGTTFQRRYDLLNASFGDIVGGFTDLRGTTSQTLPGLDLGLMVRPCDRITFGLVARNVTFPRFDLAGEGHFDLDPQVRFGIAVVPIERLTLALDVDVTQNDSETIAAFRSRQIAIGAEYVIPVGPLSIALRGGAYSNVASTANTDVAGTLGLGLGFGGFSIEMAGGASLRTIEVGSERDDVPTRLNGSVLLKYQRRFGGS